MAWRRAPVLRLALAAFLCAIVAGGCRPTLTVDPVARMSLALAAPCGLPPDRPVGEEQLGVDLAATALDAPRELEGTAALVLAHGAGAAVRLLEAAAHVDALAVAAATISRPPCRVAPADRIEVRAEGGRVIWRSAGSVAAETLERAVRHSEAAEFPEARTAIATAAAHEPVPLAGRLLALADSYARQGRWRHAERLYEQGTRAFPYVAETWAGLALSRRWAHGRLQALQASARALALRPSDAELRSALLDNPFVRVIEPLSPPALPVANQPGTWRLVQRSEPPGSQSAAASFLRAEAEAYAACREAVRRSPALRERLAGRPIADGRWSPAEESACSLLWLRTYLRHRGQGRAADPGLDELVEIARAGLLDERALHDIAALADPRLLWLLPAHRRARLFAFVEQHRAVPRQDAGFMSPF